MTLWKRGMISESRLRPSRAMAVAQRSNIHPTIHMHSVKWKQTSGRLTKLLMPLDSESSNGSWPFLVDLASSRIRCSSCQSLSSDPSSFIPEFAPKLSTLLPASNYAGLLIGAVLMGLLADNIGRRIVWQLSIFGSSVATMLAASSPNWAAINVWVAICGFFGGGNRESLGTEKLGQIG